MTLLSSLTSSVCFLCIKFCCGLSIKRPPPEGGFCPEIIIEGLYCFDAMCPIVFAALAFLEAKKEAWWAPAPPPGD